MVTAFEAIGAKTEEEKALVRAVLGQFAGKEIDVVAMMSTCIMCASFIAFKADPKTHPATFIEFLRGCAQSLEEDDDAKRRH